MSEALLMNDEAARAPAGEILDQAKVPEKTDTTSTTTDQTKTDTTQTATSQTDTAATKTDATKDTKTSLANPDTKTYDKTKATDAKVVPEKYEFKAPTGHTLDAAAIEAVTPIFKELGLTNDQAQKLIDAQVARDIAAAKAPQATYDALRTKWQTETLAHPEIKNARSGEHNGIDAVKAEMGKTLNALGDPKLAAEFKEAMDLTGAGDNPAIVRTLLKLAAFVTEGKHVAGRGPSPQGQVDPSKPAKPTAAQAMYPNNPSAAAS
jgi:hypothetical protein